MPQANVNAGRPAPPRDGLVRLLVPGEGMPAGLGLRDAGGDPGAPVMHGHFAVFNRWTKIDSFFEGTFMESIAPRAFRKTFREQRDQMRVLFQHGQDPTFANKPLGPIEQLAEDEDGAAYEVPLLDTPMIREELLPGLRANLYGASFRFRVVREDLQKSPQPSDNNPDGIPERIVREAQVYEFGPVTFPAYPEATAGVRSMTDDYFLAGLANSDPECVRAATSLAGGSGRSTFSMYVARQLGMDVEVVERDAEPADQPEEETEQESVETPGRGTAQSNAPGCPQDFPHGVNDNSGNLIACHASMVTANYHANVLTNPEVGGAVGSNSAEPDPVTTPSREAAPEPRATTPLLGVRKEPWRL